VAAGGDATATIKERPEEGTADGDPAKVIGQEDEAAVVESSAGAHEAIEAAEPAPFRLPRPQAPASQVVADGEPEPESDRPKAEGAASTQRPRIDFAPVDEKHRPRKAEPPLAPPRLPKVAAAATDEAPPTAADAVPQPAAKPVDDPFDALEAEFDKFIPLKAAPVAREPEPELGPYVEADVDRPDEALKIALSDEPVLSDGLPPEAPPAPAPGASALRGGLAGPIELEERELAPPGVEVIGSYESGGARYTMYSDGSVVVEIDGKTLKFGSLEQLREFIEAGAGKG
ncbi:MAG TPA: hypothetical protein PK812_08975, partial [Beijerinckiaceae bacterium]|nr:hypothetical protein [Beijerinckiaceae bacterium]